VTGWLTALRIARREARRSRGRTALVVALIGLPVLGLTFTAVSYDTFRLSPGERADRQMGTGDAVVSWVFSGPVWQRPTELFGIPTGAAQPRRPTDAEVLAALPVGTRVTPTVRGTHNFRTATGTSVMQTDQLDLTDPLTRGILIPLAGRVPGDSDEVALSPYAARRVGVGVGGTLRAANGSRTWRVVGLVEDPGELRRQVAVFAPGGLHPPPAPQPAEAPEGGGPRIVTSEAQWNWIVDTPAPLSWPDVRRLNETGITALSRAVLLDPPPDTEIPPELISPPSPFPIVPMLGGMLVLEVVLLAGPAFAVGARRRRRALALVAANGGTPAHLRRIVLADGVVLGVAAALSGTALGVLAAVAGQPLIEEYVAQSRPGGLRVFPLALAGLAGLAVLAGVLAALVPAWTAGRQPVVAALSGRYAATERRRRWAVAGLLLLAAGVAVTVAGGGTAHARLTAAGLVAGQLGLVLCTPTLIGLVARQGGRLPLGPRIALRDVGRNRASAAPAVAAVLAAVSVSALLGTLAAANRARNVDTDLPNALPDGYAAAQPQDARTAAPESVRAMERALRASLPVTAIVPYGTPSCRPAATKPAGTAAGTAGEDGCWAETVVPAEHRCPFVAASRNRALTPDEQRAARRDRRCDQADEIGRTSYATVTPMIVVIDPDDLRHLTRLDPAVLAAATRTLRAGGVVVDSPKLVVDGQVTMMVREVSADRPVETGPNGETVLPPGRTVRLPGYGLPPGTESPSRVFSPGALDRLGLASRPAGLVAATGRIPTDAEKDRLNAAVAAVRGWAAGVERRPQRETDPYLVLLAIGAGLITLGAAAIATGLAAADGRADLTTLAAIGASPGVRRLLSLSQTGLIAGLGSLLGMVAGLGAAGAVILGINRSNADIWPAPPHMPFAPPWLNVAISLVVVPAVAVLGAGLFTRARLPIERRTGG
jgi:putative ABC transport system permease protein